MLKFLIFFLVSTASHAYPALGDFVRYEAKYEGSMVVMEKRVLHHDVSENTFKIRTLVTYKDRVLQDETFVLPHNFLYTPEKVASVLKNCEIREGAISHIEVQGKKLTVCEFYNEESQLTDMIGPVPFGLVRFQIYLEGEEFLDFNLTVFDQLIHRFNSGQNLLQK
jgi:hypothetical protein